MTEEQRRKASAADLARYHEMTPEEKARRLALARECFNRKTPEEKQAIRDRKNTAKRERLSRQTPEQRAEYLAKKRSWSANMTERQRELARQANARYDAKPETKIKKQKYYQSRPNKPLPVGKSVWEGMKSRCYSKGSTSYHLYGARGIRVCDRWRHSFENFWADMGPTYRPELLLERIDNNGDYCPENCKWATDFEQACNKRNNRWLNTPWGELTLAQTARKLGLFPSTLYRKLKLGTMPEITDVPKTA